jgi:hypothetical protein
MRKKSAKSGPTEGHNSSSWSLREIQDSIQSDLVHTPVQEIRRRTRQQSVSLRKKCLQFAYDSLLSGELRTRETQRVSCAKLLVAMLPDSLSHIGSLLATRRSRDDYEVHFSLFCFLDEQGVKSTGTSKQVIDLLKDYLLSVERGVARSAWMAGDTLGDHWPPSESLPVLLGTLTRARFAAGRLGALHGLAHTAEKIQEEDLRKVLEILKEVADSNRSRAVRKEAEALRTEIATRIETR